MKEDRAVDAHTVQEASSKPKYLSAYRQYTLPD